MRVQNCGEEGSRMARSAPPTPAPARPEEQPLAALPLVAVERPLAAAALLFRLPQQVV